MSHPSPAAAADRRRTIEGVFFLAVFTACIPTANWLVQHVGTTCVPNGPCLIPVAPGLLAPSAVLVVGLAFVLRDLVQRRLGVGFAALAVVVGAGLSALLAPPSLVSAAGVAVLVSEFADLAVYTPLQKRKLVLAVVASSIVGLVVDSILFLQLAFGSLDHLTGQIVGKGWMVLLAIPFIIWIRARDERLGIQPA